MFSAEQYRAKAAEFGALLTSMPRSPNETTELRNLEQTYTTLAENEEWMAANIDKTIQRRKDQDNRTALVEEEEQILKCLGAAVSYRRGDDAAVVATRIRYVETWLGCRPFDCE